jgi:peroxiredoxin
MKKLANPAATLLVLFLSAASVASSHGEGPAQESKRPALGELVKEFALADSDGKVFKVGSQRPTARDEGTITVLTFWCTACPSCRMIDADFGRRAQEYKQKGVQFFAIASNHDESPEGVNRFLKQNQLGFQVLMDSQSQLARYFNASATTTSAVIDADGRLRYYGGYEKAEDAVRNLLAGEAVAIPETRPEGCEIMTSPEPEKGAPERGNHGHPSRHGQGQ